MSKMKRGRDTTVGDAHSMYGRVGFYDMKRASNGARESIRCSVKVEGFDRWGNARVIITGSEQFTVKGSSISMPVVDRESD